MAEYIASNWYWILPLVGVVGGAVVKLTPTKTDDIWWEKIKSIFMTIFDKKVKK